MGLFKRIRKMMLLKELVKIQESIDTIELNDKKVDETVYVIYKKFYENNSYVFNSIKELTHLVSESIENIKFLVCGYINIDDYYRWTKYVVPPYNKIDESKLKVLKDLSELFAVIYEQMIFRLENLNNLSELKQRELEIKRELNIK